MSNFEVVLCADDIHLNRSVKGGDDAVTLQRDLDSSKNNKLHFSLAMCEVNKLYPGTISE